ncbi:hypothetical protein V048_00463 [Staphylococcus aureus S69_POEL]|nr:hypothetical protein V048_00463 [Staphylococcus aureus S69_POEL]
MVIKAFLIVYLILGIIYLFGPFYLRRLARKSSDKDVNNYLDNFKSK